MILMAANIIKILIFLLACAICWKVIGEKIKTKFFVLTCSIILVFSFVAGYGSSMVPSLTDRIVLTATGEKTDASKGTEIVLMGYTIDETEYVAGESLKISSGKWFWRGDEYIWRPKTDDRQPDGVTESVIIELPVGWARTLNFSSNLWRGMVNIQAGDQTWTADTYADEDNSGTKNIAVGRSQTSLLIMNQIMKLGVYFIILGALVGVSLIGFRYWTQIKLFSQNHIFAICLAGIASICFVMQWHYASVQAFWGDELLQIAFSGNSSTIRDTLEYCQTFNDWTPPLFGVLLNLWYKIAPYGEKWILLPSILGICGTVILTGILGKTIAGRKVGIIASALTACSVHIIAHAGLELRSYGIFCVIYLFTLYMFVKMHAVSRKATRVVFMISMALMAYTHYMGVLCCGALFLIELCEFAIKRNTWKLILPYCGAGILYLPWCIAILPYLGNRAIPWSHPVPTIMSLLNRIQFLISEQEILMFLLFLGSIVALFLCRYAYDQNKLFCITVISMWLVVLGTYIFGSIVQNAVTFNIDRYYICFIPQTMVICACALRYILKVIGKQKVNDEYLRNIKVCGWTLVLIFLLNNAGMIYQDVTSAGYEGYDNGYRMAAEWLMKQNDIYDDRTCIVLTRREEVADGWCEYYLSKAGERDAPNAISNNEFTASEAEQYDVIYYLFREPSGQNKEALSEFDLIQEENSLGIYVYERNEKLS